MEMTESIPGLPGLFVAGVFSAALRYAVLSLYRDVQTLSIETFLFQHNVNRAKLHVWRHLRGHDKAVAASIALGGSGQSSDETDGGVDRYSVRRARFPRRETHRIDSGRKIGSAARY